MAAWHKNSRVFLDSVVWRVHQGCDVDAWQAFENELVDVKTVHLNLACDPRIQRSFLFRQTTQHGEEVLSHLALYAQQVLFLCYLLPILAACLILLPRDVHLVIQVRRNDGRGGSDGGKNLKRFCRGSVGCNGGKHTPNAEREKQDDFHVCSGLQKNNLGQLIAQDHYWLTPLARMPPSTASR